MKHNYPIKHLFIQFLFLIVCLNLITPASSLIQRYVRTDGWDGNGGTNIDNDSYGSLTKAVQDMIAANAANVSDDYEIYIEGGATYATHEFSLNGLTSLRSIKIIGDTAPTQFPSGGEVILNFQPNSAGYGIDVSGQNQDLTFQTIEFVNPNQPVMAIQNSSNIIISRCSFQSDMANTHDGLIIDSASLDVTVDSCWFTQTNQAITVEPNPIPNQNRDIIIQNCAIKNNNTGIYWSDCEHGAIINNLITTNSQFGIRLSGENINTVLFNNIIDNNTTQMFIDYTPRTVYRVTGTDSLGNPITTGFYAWRSTANVITPRTGQAFASISGTLIYNLKQWIAQTSRDYWNVSLSYPIVFDAVPNVNRPGAGEPVLGHAIDSYGGFDAPDTDINNSMDVRPLNGRDAGCIEITEDISTQFHHINLSPDANRKGPQTDIVVTVNLKDHTDADLYPQTTSKPFYLYLHDNSNPTDLNSITDITGISGPAISPVAPTPGLFEISPGATIAGSFQFNIHRNVATNSGRRYYCRIIEWDNWNAGDVIAYGGRGNDSSTRLFWTNLPDPASCQVTATTPLIASGERRHRSTLTITLNDINGDIIPSLSHNDFSISTSGGPATWNYVDERGSTPATYDNYFYTSVAGPRTITVTVLGVQLAQQPIVYVQPGLYGLIRSSQTGQPAPGVTLAVLKTSDYSQIGHAVSDSSGEYILYVPTADGSQYIVRLIDPAGHFPQNEVLLTIPGNTALEQNFDLEPIPAHQSFEAHAFPNPVKQGQIITIPYNLPNAGHFKIAVYDLRGRQVMVLFDGPAARGQGQFNWPGFNQAGKRLAPGTYRLVMTLDKAVATQKFVIVP